jgi:NADH-dependent peroxiredoxin subunit F
MLDNNLKSQLNTYLQNLRQDVRLVAQLDDGDASNRVRELLEEVAASSDKVELVDERAADADAKTGTEPLRVPSFSVENREGKPAIRFAGLPLGHEFASLVLALLQVGGHPPKNSPETLEQIRSLDGEFHFETYYSQSCQNCPDVVQALNLIAALNPRISHTAIDGSSFQDEVDERKVLAVPAVYLNGQPFASGRMNLEEILNKLDVGAGERRQREVQEKAPYDLLVVGGGPAGAAAAIYAARKGIRTGVVADRVGGQVLDTMSIENFISVSATDGPKLAAALEQHMSDYPVDIIANQRVRALHRDESIQVELEGGAVLDAATVVIATGARWRNMNVPGEEEYRTKGVTNCPHCDGPLFKGKSVAVIGGGNSGVEAAIDLAGVVKHVTLLEFADSLRADDVLQRKLRSLPNVAIVTDAQTTEVLGDGNKVTGLAYAARRSGESRRLDVEGIFVQIGLLPNTEWLQGSVDLTDRGEIIVDERGGTSIPGVFAAGDATTTPFKQIIIAAGEGAKASLGAFDYLIRSTAPEAGNAEAPASGEGPSTPTDRGVAA